MRAWILFFQKLAQGRHHVLGAEGDRRQQGQGAGGLLVILFDKGFGRPQLADDAGAVAGIADAQFGNFNPAGGSFSSRPPTVSSSWLIARLTEDFEIPSAAAASVKLRHSTTWAKIAIGIKLSDLFHPAADFPFNVTLRFCIP
ncbi:Uncharacterised protein [Pluralibacter gergoviae]|nr:Uncharacterised protein [Pluralibacter gergoviae]